MMRIAYFVNTYPAVTHTFIRREIQALEKLGVTVVRFAIRGDSRLVDDRDRVEAAQTRLILKASVGALICGVGWTALRRPVDFLRLCRQALKMGLRSDRGVLHHLAYVLEGVVLAYWCARERVEHIHVHFGSNSAAIAMFASRLSGIPFSFTVHGPGDFEKGPLLSLDEKLRFASFAACVSAFGRSQLMLLTDPTQWRKIIVIHCGLDSEFLNGEPSAVPSAPRLVCVGRLCKEKAQHVVISAARQLREAGEPCEIVLVGDGPTRGEIEELIARMNLQESIKLIGWAPSERIRTEIRSARALVLASFAENMPVVIMEAMSLGRPVISTFVAGIPEMVQPQKNGWLVPAGDETALTRAMREALAAPSDRLTAMGEAGRAYVLDQHDAVKEAQKLKDFIKTFSASPERVQSVGAGFCHGAERSRSNNVYDLTGS